MYTQQVNYASVDFLFSVTPHLGMESVATPHLDEGLLGNWDQPLLILPTGK